MENNPYRYDQNTPWSPNQAYNPGFTPVHTNQPPGAQQALQFQQKRHPRAQASKTAPARMPKTRAVALANMLKRSLAALSLAAFASFSGLIAYQQVQTSAKQGSSTSTNSTSQQKNASFFNQQGVNNLGTSTPTATATTTNEPAATATTASGSTSGSNTTVSSGPASGSHTS